MLLYRIAKKAYIEDLSGLGSRLYGGRWNEKGYSAIYTSSSLALCMCETLVHCDKSIIPQNMFFAEMEIPDEMVPADFFKISQNEETSIAGTKWLKEKSCVAIRVPSVILPAEYNKDFNVILNPEHPDFAKLKINTVVECPFDLRLF
ncbi:MAG: RES family NAD+ phosphorylase [Spirochaetales bacterium]|nr:RES family NAD+ phosphorylase [Spirochaetales bacterium]